LPAREAQDAGGEILLERGADFGQLVPTQVERLSRGVDDRCVACWSVRNRWMRTSGFFVFTLGRRPVSARKRSQTASLAFSVMNSMLFSGERIAVT
jgi:hypothetical protein